MNSCTLSTKWNGLVNKVRIIESCPFFEGNCYIFESILVVGQHVIEGVVELIRNLLDLELLSVDLIFNIIDSVVQFGNVALTIFITSFSNLESVHKVKNFVLQLFFAFSGLFCGDLELFHVFTNGFELSLDILKFSLGKFSSLSCSLAFVFLYSKLSGDFIKLLFVVTCHFGSFSQVFVSLFKFHFVVHGLVFKVFYLLQDAVSFLGHGCQFGNSFSKCGIGFLCFFFHQHDTSAKCTNIFLSVLEFLLLFFKGGQDFGQFVVSFIKLYLISLDLFAQISDSTFVLIILGVGFFNGSFKSSDGCIQGVGLTFERLHLLSDGVHFAVV